jgi:hypothetical protein
MEVEARRTGICGAVHDNRHDRRRRWRRCLRYAIGTVRSAGIVRVSSCGVVNAADLGDAIAAPGRGGVVWAFGGCALGSAGTSYPMSSYRGPYRALFCTALPRLRLAIYPTM